FSHIKKCVSYCSPAAVPLLLLPYGLMHSSVTAKRSVCVCVCVCMNGGVNVRPHDAVPVPLSHILYCIFSACIPAYNYIECVCVCVCVFVCVFFYLFLVCSCFLRPCFALCS